MLHGCVTRPLVQRPRQNPGPYLIVPHFAIFGHAADFLSLFSGTQHQYLPSLMPLGAHVVPETAPHTEEHLKGAVSFSFFLSDSSLIQYIPTAVSLPFIPPNHPPPPLSPRSTLSPFPFRKQHPSFLHRSPALQKTCLHSHQRGMGSYERPSSSQHQNYQR